MRRLMAAGICAAFMALATTTGGAQQVAGKPQPRQPGQEGITQQQADEMLKELRAIRQLLERQAANAPKPDAPAPARLADLGSHVLGRPDAPVTLVEFTDLQCTFCMQYATRTFGQIKSAYIDTGKVRYASRDFPLAQIHPQAINAAVAGRCAGEQGKFWELREALVKQAPRLSPALMRTTAESLALDMPAYDACIAAGRHAAAIERDQREGEAIGVQGTPTFLLGRSTGAGVEGIVIVGAQPFAAFDQAIKQLLTAGR